MVPEETVATPLVKVMVAALPKSTDVPVLSVTEGTYEPREVAPVKVTALSPV